MVQRIFGQFIQISNKKQKWSKIKTLHATYKLLKQIKKKKTTTTNYLKKTQKQTNNRTNK